MKRVYYTNKRQRIKQEALLRFRIARGRIDPSLLEDMRRLIVEKAGAACSTASEEAGSAPLAVDRAKNQQTILKFLALKNGDAGFARKLEALITK